jgi:GT2 family glycosyltransferase
MSVVSMIIPNWNRREDLERLVRLLARDSHLIREIIVVDNGSRDGSAESAERAGARVIRLDRNVGFAAAVNRGIEASSAGYLAVLNNDVEPADGWLPKLLEAAAGPGVWFATGRILNARLRGSIDATFDTICRGACSWRAGHGRADSPEWRQPQLVHMIPFTAAVFRAELFRRVGLLDERFESYLEDVDFGLRCAAAGLAGAYVPEAVAFHQGSATLGAWHADTVRRISRNQLLLVAKHFPRNWVRRYGWPVLVAQAAWGLLAARHGRGWAYLRGKIEGLRSYREVRRRGPAGDVTSVLEQSERRLLDLQRRTGFDWYWRLYFALT